ncbi:hypothetical protein AHAS_Ahas20G0116300 [Arachis hypogaea]
MVPMFTLHKPQRRPLQLSEQGQVLEIAIETAANVILDLKDSPNDWVSKVGDGDCGSTMYRGAKAILEDIKNYPLNDAAETVNEIGSTIRRAMGGSRNKYTIFYKAAYTQLKPSSGSVVTPKQWDEALALLLLANMGVLLLVREPRLSKENVFIFSLIIIGALNPDRLKKFQERYASFNDPVIPKFHYGSHYSSAGTVLYYLVRVEPFTTLAIKLQCEKFDHADRMFSDVSTTWNGVLEDMSDVKELLLELFYLPEVLTNKNSIDFGTTQLGEKLDTVRLPPWAENLVYFVHKHWMVLESEYASAHLHEWIDLIFGYALASSFLLVL